MTPGLAIARRIVTLPPWMLTVLLLGLNILDEPVAWAFGLPILGRALSWLMVVVAMGWIWSVYTVSIAAMPARPRPTWEVWAFTAPPLIGAVAAVANLSMYNTLPAFLFFAAFLFCVGKAAVELETADNTGVPAGMGKTLGTALLLFLSIIGVWWLRQRLLRVANRTAQV